MPQQPAHPLLRRLVAAALALGLGATPLAPRAGAEPRSEPVAWARLTALEPGQRLWADTSAGERLALRFVRATGDSLLTLDPPTGWSEKQAGSVCRSLASNPSLHEMVLGRGPDAPRWELAPLRRDLARGQVLAVSRQRQVSGRRGLAIVLGAISALALGYMAVVLASGGD